GLYECRATNQFGQDSVFCKINVESSKSIILDTQLPIEHCENIQLLEARISRPSVRPANVEQTSYRPRFIGNIESVINRTEGDALHIECRVEPSNDPDLTIEWF